MNTGKVYDTLREELNSSYNRQVNLITFGFTATVLLIGYGFASTNHDSLIFLLPLLILGALLIQLDNSIFTILTISIYIRIFIERNGDFPKWETNIGALRTYLRNVKPFALLRPYNPLTFFESTIYAGAVGIMGAICIVIAWVNSTHDYEKWITGGFGLLWIVICVLIFRPLIFVNSGAYEEKLQAAWEQLIIQEENDHSASTNVIGE